MDVDNKNNKGKLKSKGQTGTATIAASYQGDEPQVEVTVSELLETN